MTVDELRAACPDGYTIVPVEPTEAMIESGVQAENASFRAQPDECWMRDARKAMMLAGYKAMIAAIEGEQ